MTEQTVALEIFVQIFVIGAFAFYLACSAVTVVMMIYLTSLPERRAARPRPQPEPQVSIAAGSAD